MSCPEWWWSPERDANTCIEYDYSFFGNRTANIDDQTGIERYTVKDELVHGYSAVSLIPISDIGYDERAAENRKTDTNEKSRQAPLIVATMMNTEKLESPKLDPGIYTIYYRAKGLPDELTQALKVGQRELIAADKAAKAAAKGGEKKKKKKEKEEEPAKKDEKTGEPDWRAVVAKYGVTEQEVFEHGHKLITLRMREGEYAFSVEENVYLFRNNGDATGGEGKFVGHLTTNQKLESKGGYRGAKLSLTQDNSGRPIASFVFGVATTGNRHFNFELALGLEEPVDTSRPWRVPPGTSVTLGDASASVGNGSENGASPGTSLRPK